MKDNARFSLCTKKGFKLRFDNGVVLSTQFGWGNYCENHDAGMPRIQSGQLLEPGWESNDAEVAIFSPDREWLTKEYKDDGDDVLGYVTFDEWLKIFDWCRNWKPSLIEKKV